MTRAILFLALIFLLTLFAVSDAFLKQDARRLALVIFAVIPFVIGRLASYRTLGFYTTMQILALLLSAATLHVA